MEKVNRSHRELIDSAIRVIKENEGVPLNQLTIKIRNDYESVRNETEKNHNKCAEYSEATILDIVYKSLPKKYRKFR